MFLNRVILQLGIANAILNTSLLCLRLSHITLQVHATTSHLSKLSQSFFPSTVHFQINLQYIINCFFQKPKCDFFGRLRTRNQSNLQLLGCKKIFKPISARYEKSNFWLLTVKSLFFQIFKHSFNHYNKPLRASSNFMCFDQFYTLQPLSLYSIEVSN